MSFVPPCDEIWISFINSNPSISSHGGAQDTENSEQRAADNFVHCSLLTVHFFNPRTITSSLQIDIFFNKKVSIWRSFLGAYTMRIKKLSQRRRTFGSQGAEFLSDIFLYSLEILES